MLYQAREKHKEHYIVLLENNVMLFNDKNLQYYLLLSEEKKYLKVRGRFVKRYEDLLLFYFENITYIYNIVSEEVQIKEGFYLDDKTHFFLRGEFNLNGPNDYLFSTPNVQSIEVKGNLSFEYTNQSGTKIYFNSLPKKNVLYKVDVETSEFFWQVNLNTLKDKVESWKNCDEDLTIQSKVEKWNEDLIFIAGTYNLPFLISINSNTGFVNWISDSNPLAFHFYIKNNLAFNHGLVSRNNGYINVIDLKNGNGQKIDISEQSRIHSINGTYASLLCDNYFVSLDSSNLKFGLLNIDTWQYEFVHQFIPGKNIAKEVWQIYPPQYHNSRIYVNDSEGTLHIFERENV